MRSLLVALGGGFVGALVAASAIRGQTPETMPRVGVPAASESDHVTCESMPQRALPPAPATTSVVGGEMLVAEISADMLPGCQDATPPSCAGACPPFNACQGIRLGSLEICSCVGERSVCGTADPLCGGVCPPGLVCAGDVFGFGSCRCDPPLPKAATTVSPAGTVSPASKVSPASTISAVTTTNPVTTTTLLTPACKASQYPGCGGECLAGEVCVAYVDRVAVGSCGCFPAHSVGMPCTDATVPECDGACPSGTACMEDEGLGGCVCFDLLGAKCGFFGPPECAGDCPAEKPTCRKDGAGGCVCAP